MARLQVLLAAVCFGTTGTAQALGPSMDPAVVGTARIVIGALLLALVAVFAARQRTPGGADARAVSEPVEARPRLRGEADARAVPALGEAPPRLRDRRGLLLVAGSCVAIYQVTFFAAVAETGVAVGTVVAIGSAPAFIGVFERLSGGEALSRRWLLATALACAGAALLLLAGQDAEVAPGGVALALCAGAGYAAYAVASKRLLDAGHAPETVMAAVFGAGALLVSPLLAILPASELLTSAGAALAIYLCVVPTALAYVLFAHGLRRIPASETGTLTLAEPLTASALGVAVLGERPGAVAAAGAVLVLAGLLLIAVRPAPARAAAPVVGAT